MRSPLRQFLLLTVTIGDFASLRLSLGAFIELRFISYHPGLIFPTHLLAAAGGSRPTKPLTNLKEKR
jgi:hypothetical protein